MTPENVLNEWEPLLPNPSPRVHQARSFNALAGLALALLAAPLAIATTNPVGGGYLHSGLEGDYFGNNSFTGSPVFERRDIRLDFDWGTAMRPGGGLQGSTLASVTADNYSVRWEGQIMARFSETYTFKTYGDSVRIWIKPTTQGTYGTALINYWPGSDPASYTAQTANFAMTAGQAYDIKVEYRERTGAAQMRLLWSSPSTPEEVIQPTAYVGMQPPGRNVMAADAIWGATNWGDQDGVSDGDLTRDANGWPTEDFSFLIRPQDDILNPGTYLLQFKGQARVYVHLTNNETWASADGTVSFGTELNPGEGYDSGTNTTTARLTIPAGSNNCWPTFKESDRDGPGSTYGTNSGVADLKLMRPTQPGGSEPHRVDEIFARDTLKAMERFVTYRWNDVNGNGDVEWTDRKNLIGVGGDGTNENHEYKILWCNQVGRDLWIQVPHRVTDDYITKMAQLLRYGSDASGIPYISPQANPFHPPLNPNLRVMIEYTNECPWNSAGQYPQANWVKDTALAEISANSAKGQILNYDGTAAGNSLLAGKRWMAVRIKEISDIFRGVWGDDAMPAPGKQDAQVRPIFMYQYDNTNNTAKDVFHFLDDYFNKTDPASPYTGTARPVSYYLYGGGGAAYYASADRNGIDDLATFNLNEVGGFEQLSLNPGEAAVAPTGTPWSFTGNAGIYHRAARSGITVTNLGTTTTSVDQYVDRGFKFTVGAQDIAVYELGRYRHSGNNGDHYLQIIDVATNSPVKGFTLSMDEGTVGSMHFRHMHTLNFVASQKVFSHPVILEAGKSYYLVSAESNGGDAHTTESTVAAPAGITINGTVKGYNNNGTRLWVEGTTVNRTFGPISMRFAAAPIVASGAGLTLGFLQDSKEDRDSSMRGNDPADYSDQAAFMTGTSTMEADVTFPATGLYGLVYHIAYKRDQQPYLDTDGDGAKDDENPQNTTLRVYLVDNGTEINISPRDQSDTRVGTWGYEGYWTKPSVGFDYFGSAPFRITDASKTYKIRFKTSSSNPDLTILLDNILIASSRKMMEGTIPYGGGFAEGQPDVSNWEAEKRSEFKYAQAFGLKGMIYEGGWYPGGDANKMPLQFAAAYESTDVKAGEIKATDTFARIGLAISCDYTRTFAVPDWDFINSGNYARIQAWDEVNARLPAEADNGLPLNSTFAQSSKWWQEEDGDGTLEQGEWFSWNVIAPQTGDFNLRLDAGSGGNFRVEIDGVIVFTGATGSLVETSTPVFLTKGLHAIRLVCTGGNFVLNGLAAAEDGIPYGFDGLVGNPGSGVAYLEWPAQSGVSGYNIYYRDFIGGTWTKHNSALQTGTLYVADDLTNGSSYNFAVTYVSGGVESAYSNSVLVIPAADAPMISWEFDDTVSKVSVPNKFAAPGLKTAVLGMSPSFSSTTSTHVSGDAFGTTTQAGTSLNTNHYFTVTVEPEADHAVSLNQLVFGAFTQYSDTQEYWVVRYSLNGFQTFTEMTNNVPANPITGTSLNAGTGKAITIDLSGQSALQNREGPVEFRIYYYYGTRDSWGKGLGKLSSGSNDFIDMKFSGTVTSLAVPPEITTQPASQTVKEGINASLSVAASGSDLTYQWQSTSVGGSSWSNISGATSSTLSISNVVAGDQKDYRVVVTNSHSLSTTSNRATLTVDLVPRITTASLPNAQEGQTYSYTLAAASGTGTLIWSATGLPGGLSLSSAGVLSGTPAGGTSTNSPFSANITVSDASSPADTDTETFPLVVSAPPSGEIVTLAQWEFDNANPKVSPVVANTTHAAIASASVVQAGLPFSSNSYYTSDAVGVTGGNSVDLATAVANNDYIAWTLQIASGETVSLSDLLVGVFYQYTTKTFSYEIRASADPANFASTFVTLSETPDGGTARAGTGLGTSSALSVTADLGGISQLQNLAGGTTVEFRVYIWGAASQYEGIGIGKRGDATVDLQVDGVLGASESWTSQDVGNVAAAGSSSYDAATDTFTLIGSGADIWGAADEFHYLTLDGGLTGDGAIQARVVSVHNTHGWAKAGVMIRETNAANSRHAMMVVTPTSGVSFQRRTATGGTSASTTTAGQTAPKWVKISRTGNIFRAYWSNDGSTWTKVGSDVTIAMAATAEIGLCVTSHKDGTLCTAVFDNVTVTP